MSKFTLGVFVSICLLIVPMVHAADNGLFMVVKGSVKVISGKDKSTAIAKVGSKVFSGDTVVTEKDSRAKIVMADRNVLQLSPDTKFEITSYKTSEVESERTAQLALMQGKVRAQVEQKYGEKNKFEMRTPTAVAGVRGTAYAIQFNPSTAMTSIMVMSGKVMVGTISGGASPVMVTPNMGVNVGANATQLQTFAVSKSEMNEFNGTNDSSGGKKDDTGKDSGDRGPSSDSSGDRMIGSDDHGGESITKTENAPPLPPPQVMLPPPVMPTPPVAPTPPIPEAAKRAVQSTGTKTKVIVTPVPK